MYFFRILSDRFRLINYFIKDSIEEVLIFIRESFVYQYTLA